MAEPEVKSKEGGEEVTPPEDLMREHGFLDRVMLIYEAVIAKFGSGEDFDSAVLTDSATIVREFIEDYHEKLEENYVFPRFKQAGQMVELVNTLLDFSRIEAAISSTFALDMPLYFQTLVSRQTLVSTALVN